MKHTMKKFKFSEQRLLGPFILPEINETFVDPTPFKSESYHVGSAILVEQQKKLRYLHGDTCLTHNEMNTYVVDV